LICTTLFYADDLMKPHDHIRVIRKWRDLRADPVLRCLDDSDRLNNRYLPSGHGSRVCEMTNGLRLGTTVLSQDLSEA
jgi:hypothetical protein